MTDYRFPHGGKAWFVWRLTKANLKIEPVSREGWIATGAFVALALLGTLGILLSAPGSGVAAMGAVTYSIVLTALYVALAIRMSVPERR